MPQTRRPENKEFLKYDSRSLRFRQFNLHIKSKVNKMKFMNSLKTEKRDRRQWQEASVCLLGSVGGGVGGL
jgi:hypothetical protein